MKKLFIAPALALLSLAIAQQSLASDGTINFNGQVTDVTCTIKVNGGTSNATITLPTVAASALSSGVGATAGDTPFSINLSGCSTADSGTEAQPKGIAVYFEPAGGSVNPAGRLDNTDITGPGNVNIALYKASAPTLPLFLGTAPTAADTNISGADPSGAAEVKYVAKYYNANGSPAVPGAVAAHVVYSIVYP